MLIACALAGIILLLFLLFAKRKRSQALYKEKLGGDWSSPNGVDGPECNHKVRLQLSCDDTGAITGHITCVDHLRKTKVDNIRVAGKLYNGKAKIKCLDPDTTKTSCLFAADIRIKKDALHWDWTYSSSTDFPQRVILNRAVQEKPVAQVNPPVHHVHVNEAATISAESL